MKYCTYEIAPYTGNGVDPPACGAVAVSGRFCAAHARLVEESSAKADAMSLRASPRACAVADAWLAWTRRPGASYRIESGTGPQAEAFNLALEALELATRESPLRKVKP